MISRRAVLLVPRLTQVRHFAAGSSGNVTRTSKRTVDEHTQSLLAAPPSRTPKALTRIVAALKVKFSKDTIDPTLKSLLDSASAQLYYNCANNYNYEKLCQSFGLPDYMSSWYKLTLLHVWMVLMRLHVSLDADAYLRLQRGLLSTMLLDVDNRLQIVGDELRQVMTSKSVMKHMHGLNLQTFLEYDEGFLHDDRVFAAAVWRCLYMQRPCDPIQVLKAVTYMRSREESKLDDHVQSLMSLISNVQAMEEAVMKMEYDSAKTPLGSAKSVTLNRRPSLLMKERYHCCVPSFNFQIRTFSTGNFLQPQQVYELIRGQPMTPLHKIDTKRYVAKHIYDILDVRSYSQRDLVTVLLLVDALFGRLDFLSKCYAVQVVQDANHYNRCDCPRAAARIIGTWLSEFSFSLQEMEVPFVSVPSALHHYVKHASDYPMVHYRRLIEGLYAQLGGESITKRTSQAVRLNDNGADQWFWAEFSGRYRKGRDSGVRTHSVYPLASDSRKIPR